MSEKRKTATPRFLARWLLRLAIWRGAVKPQHVLRTLSRERPILLAVDSSGSMHLWESFIRNWIEVFTEAGAEVVAFTHELLPIEAFPAYGGTDFGRVQQYAEGLPEHPQVVMFTDGMGRAIKPINPDLWTWALTEDCNRWMEPMTNFVISKEGP